MEITMEIIGKSSRHLAAHAHPPASSIDRLRRDRGYLPGPADDLGDEALDTWLVGNLILMCGQ